MPAWSNGAVLLVPLTEKQVQEAGLELKAHHVVALSADRTLVEEAMASLPKRRRPKVKAEHNAIGSRDAQDALQSRYGPSSSGSEARIGSDRPGPYDCGGRDVPDRAEILVERTFVHYAPHRPASECSVRARSVP